MNPVAYDSVWSYVASLGWASSLMLNFYCLLAFATRASIGASFESCVDTCTANMDFRIQMG